MQAHGMCLSGNIRNRLAHGMEIENVYGDIIIKALLNRGYSVARLEPEYHRTIAGGFVFDMELKTDAIPRGDGIWGFEFCRVQTPSHGVNAHIGAMKAMNVIPSPH